jgi:heat shock protein HslJ
MASTRFACCLAVLVALMTQSPLRASEAFPFGSELMLDTPPMHGSKRVPMLEIDDNGAAAIDLWCSSVRAQATVGDATITIVPGDMAPAQCAPERQASDLDLLATLAQVTAWRRIGEIIELSGSTTLRFRLMTN